MTAVQETSRPLHAGNLAQSLTNEEYINLWAKYEQVAMHFNDLLMRLRTQALGAVATIAAAGGFLLSTKVDHNRFWIDFFALLLFLTVAWIAVALLDTFYYGVLLLGAVDALLDLESRSQSKILFSSQVEARFHKGPESYARRTPWPIVFYAIVLTALCVALLYAWFRLPPRTLWPLRPSVVERSQGPIAHTRTPVEAP
jgi:hypothetical protein